MGGYRMLTLHVYMYQDRHLAFLIQFLNSAGHADRLHDSKANMYSCCEHSLVRVCWKCFHGWRDGSVVSARSTDWACRGPALGSDQNGGSQLPVMSDLENPVPSSVLDRLLHVHIQTCTLSLLLPFPPCLACFLFKLKNKVLPCWIPWAGTLVTICINVCDFSLYFLVLSLSCLSQQHSSCVGGVLFC